MKKTDFPNQYSQLKFGEFQVQIKNHRQLFNNIVPIHKLFDLFIDKKLTTQQQVIFESEKINWEFIKQSLKNSEETNAFFELEISNSKKYLIYNFIILIGIHSLILLFHLFNLGHNNSIYLIITRIISIVPLAFGIYIIKKSS